MSVHYDGACGPTNPGGVASYGFVVRGSDNNIIHEGAGYVGEGPQMSNNVAEYEAVAAALQYILDRGWKDIEVRLYGDSMLTVEQMSGRWKFKGGLYLKSARKACYLGNKFKKISFTWIPREQNQEADELSKQFSAPLSRAAHEAHLHIGQRA